MFVYFETPRKLFKIATVTDLGEYLNLVSLEKVEFKKIISRNHVSLVQRLWNFRNSKDMHS